MSATNARLSVPPYCGFSTGWVVTWAVVCPEIVDAVVVGPVGAARRCAGGQEQRQHQDQTECFPFQLPLALR